jgi:hypothetical protein
MLSNLKQTTKHMQAFHSRSLLSRISVCKSKFQKGGGRQKDQWPHTHTHQEYDKICQEAVVVAAAVR